MEEDTPSEDCGQQSSQYLEPLFYVKIAPVDDEGECSAEATDRSGLMTNNSLCDINASPERVDDKANVRDSVNVGEIVNWGEAPIVHTSDCLMSNFCDTAFNDVAIGEPLLIQPEQNFSANVETDIGLQGDEPMEVKLEKAEIEPDEEQQYDPEEFGGEFNGTFPLENCCIKTEPNSDVIDSFDQWESAQRVLNGAVTDPRNAIQAGANEKTKNPKIRKRRTNLSLYKESRKRRKKTDEDGDGKHVCSLCSRIFRTQELLDQHCANHDLMTYKCAVCGWAYNAAHLVESHIRRHHYKEQEGDLPKLWVKADMTCRECLQKFNSLFSLEVHMKTHGEEIKCHNCDKSFRSLNRLLRHQEYCPNQKQNSSANTDESQNSSCPYCPRKFKFTEKLEDHIVDHRNGKFPFKCSHSGCRWEFETYDELNEHGREHGGLCPNCPRTFTTSENLQKHIRDHTKGKFRFKCPHGGCRWEFKSYGELHSHRRRHGGLLICSRCHTEVWSKAVYEEHAAKCIDQLQCENCQAVFCSNDELKAHECVIEENDTNVKDEQLQKKCSICEETFLSKTFVKSYATYIRGKYKCTECPEEFQSVGLANYHAYVKHFGMVRVDIGSAKLYKCYSCTRRFTTLGRLKQHIAYHTQFKYKCTRPGCGWVFDQNEFEVHVNIYHNRPEVPKVRSEEMVCPKCLPGLQPVEGCESFTCNECPKTFASKAQRFEHVIAEHVGGQMKKIPFTCSLCTRQFTSKSKLQEHVKNHQLLEWKCPDCGWTFENKSITAEHIKETHGSSNSKPMMVHTIYKCSECGKDFPDVRSIGVHMRIHTTSKLESTKTKASLKGESPALNSKEKQIIKLVMQKRIRVITENPAKTSKEKLIDTSTETSTEKPVKKSVQQQAKVQKSICITCDQVFSTPELLKSHVICEHEKKSPASNTCDLKLTAEIRQVQEYSKVMECKCPHCRRTYSTLLELKTHLNSHHKDHQPNTTGGWQLHIKNLYEHVTKCKCASCGKIFSSHEQLKSHVICQHARKASVEDVHDLKPVSGIHLNICKSLLELKTHLNSHPEHDRPNATSGWQGNIANLHGYVAKCICGKTFSSNDQLKSHLICEHARKSSTEDVQDLKPAPRVHLRKTSEENPVKKSGQEQNTPTSNISYNPVKKLGQEQNTPTSNISCLKTTLEAGPVQGYSDVMECKCPHCGQICKTLLELETHLDSHPEHDRSNVKGGRQAYIAYLCGYVTKCKCIFCGKIFSSHEQLKSHATREHARTASSEDVQDIKPASRVHLQKTSEEELVKKSGQEQNSPTSNISDSKTTPEAGPMQGYGDVMECKCPQCGQTFKTLLELKTHLNSHPDNQWSNTHIANLRGYVTKCKCTSCGKIFSSDKQLKSHVIWEHARELNPAEGERNVQDVSEVLECKCSHCAQTYKTLGELQAHFSNYREHDQLNTTGVRQTHISNLYGYVTLCKCTLCGEVFSSHEQLKSHVICSHARKSSASKPGPKMRNVQDYSEVTECKCSHCGEKYKTLADLQEHFRCLPGHFHFNKTVNRQAHVSNLYGYVTQCKCALCGKEFSSHEELKAHGICEHEWKVSAASDSSDLKPKQMPSGVKELCDVIQCKCVQCGQKYETLKELQDHLTSVPEHDKCDTYDLQPSRIAALFGSVSQCKCPVCEVIFDNHAQLKSHVICEHERCGTSDLWPSPMANLFRDLTQCKCPLCGKVFPSDEQLKSHVICGHEWKSSGADGMQGKCLLCEKVFSSFEQLKSHVICEHERKPSAEHERRPSAEHERRPSAEHERRPSAEHERRPSAKHERRPSAEHERKPSAEHERKPSAEHERRPSAEHERRPSAEHERKPSAEHERRPSAEHERRPSAEHERKPSAEHERKPSAEHERKPSAEDAVNHKETPVCTLCGEIFPTHDKMKSHILSEHIPKPDEASLCSSCSESFLGQHKLKSQIRAEHTTGPTTVTLCALCGKIFRSQKQLKSHTICKHRTENKSNVISNISKATSGMDWRYKLIVESTCFSCGVLLENPARLKAHNREYHKEQPGVKANYDVKSRSLKTEPGVEENRHTQPKSVSSSSHVPKNQSEGFTIDDEAKVSTVTDEEGTKETSSVFMSDEDSDTTISVTEDVEEIYHPKSRSLSPSCQQDEPGVEENDRPKFTSLSSSYQQDESGAEENNRPNPRFIWSSSLVSKSQLEGFTIDEEAKANTVWVNVPTIKQGTSPARGRSSVLLSDDVSDDDSDDTISITDGDILSTLGHPRLVLHRVSDEDIEMMTPSTETFHNIFA